MRRYIPPNAKLVPANAERVFKGIIHDVYQWDQEEFDGSTQRYEALKRPDTVHIICVRDNELIVLEQEQPHEGKFFSFPGGRVDPEDEDELAAAKREVLEEIGARFKTWKLISAVQGHAKIDHFVYTFLASDFEGEEPASREAGERIKINSYGFESFINLVDEKGFRYPLPKVVAGCRSIDDLMKLPELV